MTRATTNFRVTGVQIARGNKLSTAADTSGLVAVSTGLTSPAHALASLRSSATAGKAQTSHALRLYKCSGSYAYFRMYLVATATMSIQTASYVAFDWAAWET